MARRGRDTSKDGFFFRIQYYALGHFRAFWNLVNKSLFLRRCIAKYFVSTKTSLLPNQPFPLTTMAPYTSWDSLTDKTYNARYLPPNPAYNAQLPPVEEVVKLFVRDPYKKPIAPNISMLLPSFASWVLDSIFYTDRKNPLKNHSTHQVDLSILYGRTKAVKDALRAHQGGKLKNQFINGEEFPPYCYENGELKNEFSELQLALYPHIFGDDVVNKEKLNTLFASTERANIQVGYMLFNVLFLREHNRICDLLAKAYPDWDDERLYQTARNINIVLALKIILEDYVFELAGYYFKLPMSPTSFHKKSWSNISNWVSIEFNLAYRWHSMIPDEVIIRDRKIPTVDTLYNNSLLTEYGLAEVLQSYSKQEVGAVRLFNTPAFLLPVEKMSIELGRQAQLASYNDYRELFKFPRLTDFRQMTDDQYIIQNLEKLYGHIDNVEFYVGLFAEEFSEKTALNLLMGRIIIIDALEGVLRNPLLREQIYNENTFSPIGMNIINSTNNVSDILHRNIPQKDKQFYVSFAKQKN